MDMGVIKNFKDYFRRYLVLQLIDRRERGLDDKITVLDAIHLMKDAWDTVKPTTIENCFKKSNLVSDPIIQILDEEIPFSEWLMQQKITNFNSVDNIDEFVHIDDDLTTSGIPTEEDIIDAVLNKEDSDEDDEEVVHTKPIVSYTQEQDALMS